MDAVWLQNYPAGVAPDISAEAAQFSSLVEMFEQSCRKHAANTAYISFGCKLGYAELYAQARNFAAWLQQRGLAQGQRVALMLPNLLQYPVCLFGSLMAGAVVVNTNPLYTSDELHHQLIDSGAHTVVVAEQFAHTLERALPGTQVSTIVLTGVGDLLFWPKSLAVNLASRYLRKSVAPWRLPNYQRLGKILRRAASFPYIRPQLNHSDLAFLQYTGGTTGVAKGAMLSHGNLLANICQAHAWIAPSCAGPKECVVTALPLYHVFAMTANCLTFMYMGASNLLIADPRDLKSFLRNLQKNRFSALTGVNTLFKALIEHPDFARLDFSALHLSLGGGMAVQAATAQRWRELTGSGIVQAYGLTETSPAVTINRLDDQDFNDSIGLPLPSTQVQIRLHNQPLTLGEAGEICIKGPQVCAGYWQRPHESGALFDADGWLLSGDIGRMDERGYVYLLDRKKDMILVSGFNVYPNEIEAVLASHPDILEAVAVGVPDAKTGEAIRAYVIARTPELQAVDVIKFCREHLTGYKIPHQIIFRQDLPRSNVGKILRKALREQALAELGH